MIIYVEDTGDGSWIAEAMAGAFRNSLVVFPWMARPLFLNVPTKDMLKILKAILKQGITLVVCMQLKNIEVLAKVLPGEVIPIDPLKKRDKIVEEALEGLRKKKLVGSPTVR